MHLVKNWQVAEHTFPIEIHDIKIVGCAFPLALNFHIFVVQQTQNPEDPMIERNNQYFSVVCIV